MFGTYQKRRRVKLCCIVLFLQIENPRYLRENPVPLSPVSETTLIPTHSQLNHFNESMTCSRKQAKKRTKNNLEK